MRKSTKIIVIISSILMLVGWTITSIGARNGGMTTICWDRSQNTISSCDIDNIRVIQKRVRVDEFEDVVLKLDSVDVELIPSNDYYIEYSVVTSNKKSLSVEDGVLTFIDDNSNCVFVSLEKLCSLKSAVEIGYIKIYYPAEESLNIINIDMDMGTVKLSDLSVQDVDVSINTGNLEMKNCEIDTADIELGMGNGDIKYSKLKSLKSMISVGDFALNNSSVGESIISLDNGNAQIDNIVVSNSLIADIEMGNASVLLNEESSTHHIVSYGYMLETEMGKIVVNSKDMGNYTDSDGNVLVKISCDIGNIELKLD